MTVRTFLTDEDIEKYCTSFDKKTIWIDTSPDTRGVFCFKMLTPSNLFISVSGYVLKGVLRRELGQNLVLIPV